MSRGPSPLRPPFTPFNPDDAVSPIDREVHPVIHVGRVAVITGAASGIGKAAALELAKQGLRIVLADVNEEQLKEAAKETAKIVGESNVLAMRTDVSVLEDVVRLRDKVFEQWGEVSVLMNNAGIGLRGTSWDGLDNWKQIFDVNVFGVLNVQQTFVPYMIHQENPSVIINTGSKQGITNPPGNAAYNASKAAVKSITEGLAWELRQQPTNKLTAHLFVPGWTWTGMTSASAAAAAASSTDTNGNGNGTPHTDINGNATSNPLTTTTHTHTPGSGTHTNGRTTPTKDSPPTKPAGAWSAEETVLYMLDKLRLGQFYIIVPDNETRKEVDALRIMWAAGDITEGRPALSRWHPQYTALFEEYMRDSLAQMQ
ncbi:NAD-binding protein [Rickenella mellea]|uniref:NAD-binding protein n=1 Tax=Rickenella mellea TaxID=50990 RepID=A0A4Y7PYQ8_9AGAM|nr:NAD-binding protein [Rickenella mellea]